MLNITEIQKRNDQEYKENKKGVNFRLSGNNKYYYANQCRILRIILKSMGLMGLTTIQHKKSKTREFLLTNIQLI